MAAMTRTALDYEAMDEATLVAQARGGDRDAFRQVMRRCNQRLFRIARSLLHDDAEAEDLVQESYLHAYEKLDEFRGEATLMTWLTRIVLNGANSRLRHRRPMLPLDALETPAEGGRVIAFPSRFGTQDPAASAAIGQVRRLLEQAIDALPEPFRLVFVLRDIEGCTVEETANSLGIRAETVKTRLHRARKMLRADLQDTVSAMLGDAFPFLGVRCARMTEAVMARLPDTHESRNAHHDDEEPA